jgi:hypothetical protein
MCRSISGERVEAVAAQGGEQIVKIGEVSIDRRLRDADALGDVAQREMRRAPLPHQLQRRF